MGIISNNIKNEKDKIIDDLYINSSIQKEVIFPNKTLSNNILSLIFFIPKSTKNWHTCKVLT